MKLAALRKELKAFYAEQLPRITADYSVRCWGDQSKESASLMAQLCHDLGSMVSEQTVAWDGKAALGNMVYMEMPRHAKTLRATPDGRRNGD